MTNLIKDIAAKYPRLISDGVRKRSSVWAVVLHNTEVGGQALDTHPSGKRISDLVCVELGYVPLAKTTARVKGSLDDY